ncbi:hypothetical protein Tco_1358882 [Tanacetum coccineum]
MAPRGRPTRTTRSRPVTTTPPPVTDPTTTTSVTSAQLQAMIDEGVTAVWQHVLRPRNCDDSHKTLGTGVRRNELHCRECTYQDLHEMSNTVILQGTEGVGSDLTHWFEMDGNRVSHSNCHFEESSGSLTLEANEMATELMDRRINTLEAERTENKRKFEDTPRYNQNQQPNKRQTTGRAYAAGNGDRKPYEGTKPRCPKCLTAVTGSSLLCRVCMHFNASSDANQRQILQGLGTNQRAHFARVL